MKVNTTENFNEEPKDLQPTVQPERPRLDVEIYDLRRQIDHREQVKEYIKSEIARQTALLDTLTREIISLDLKLEQKGKPAGEPSNRRYLYAPEEVMRPQLTDGADNAMDAEIVE